MDSESLVRVQRGAGRLRVFGHQFQIAESGDGGDREGDQEGKPRRPTDFRRHITGQRIHTGAQDVADDEQQQQLWTHHPLGFWLA